MQIKNHLRLGIIISLLLTVIPVLFCQDWDTEILSQMDEFIILKNRITLSAMNSKITIIDVREGLQSKYFTYGFDSPLVCFGILKQRGIFRELDNPFGVTPCGDVFFEKPGFYRDNSFSGGKRKGIFITPFSEFLLFAFSKISDYSVQAHALANIFNSKHYDFKIASVLSFHEKESPGEDWIYPKMVFPGNKIAHIIGGINLKTDAFKAGTITALSGGSYLKPGLFGRVLMELKNPFYKNIILFSGCSDSYITPKGEFPDNSIVYGGDVTLFHEQKVNIYGEYLNKISRLPILPSLYRESEENTSAAVRFLYNCVTGDISYKRNILYRRTGIIEFNRKISCRFVVKSSLAKIKLKAQYSRDNFGDLNKLFTAILLLKPGRTKIDFKMSLNKGIVLTGKGSLKVTVKMDRGESFITFKIPEELDLEHNLTFSEIINPAGFSFGWSFKS